ncbi:unnamed protein product [Callosobruchus maculatus]|uniref:Gamma-glutamyltransferase n=1 Tax=Callosobruchus maculatus TaxID=64391 RepID=A0A653BGR3_CALMS|nr:unnamed protein product [Callosobruchus maculatus]
MILHSRSIFERGGNVVEAAIATLFCDGVFRPMSVGIGGGFTLTMYNRTTGEIFALNSREKAPAAADEHMFDNLPGKASIEGGLAVAVPGELKGYWVLYETFGGNIPWKDLVQPSIDFCNDGIYLDGYSAHVLQIKKATIYKDPGLRSVFWNYEINDTYKEGDYVYRPKLARTLKVIAEEGGLALHDGSLTESFVEDIQKAGGIITVEDMNSYRPQWVTPIEAQINGQRFITMGAPAAGSVLIYILQILDGLLVDVDPNSVIATHRIIEAFKFGYGARTRLGDPYFYDKSHKEFESHMISKEFAKRAQAKMSDGTTSTDPLYYDAELSYQLDHGTAALLFLAENGDAISITSTVNFYFGAGFMGESTGIIPNDQMDDFSKPHGANGFGLASSPTNYIAPGKRPQSSMTPTIIVNQDGDVEMIIAAAGGSRITSTVATTIIRNLWFNLSLNESINEKRFHHQLSPMKIEMERDFAKETLLLEELELIGHTISLQEKGGSAVSAIRTHPYIVANSDGRRKSYVSYIEN